MSRTAIIGAGPAGCICAITIMRNNPYVDVVLFEKKDVASTLLPTGGGRCNLSYNEPDIKTFVQNYPRGEKFLYSVFTQFFVPETREFFKSIGVKTYIQEDLRIFPRSDKSLDVIFALKNEIKKIGIEVKIADVIDFEKTDNGFVINGEKFDNLVIAVGGRKSPLVSSIEKLGLEFVTQKPALTSLTIKEKYFAELSGISLRKISAKANLGKKKIELKEDLLFTHKGISGPLAYKISSLFARENYAANNPILLKLDFLNGEVPNLQEYFDKNPHKEILNFISEFMPKSLAKVILKEQNLALNKKCSQVNKEERLKLEKILTSLTLQVISPLKDGEIVSAGGVSLKEINSKTMETKKIENLYFCGEILDIDGFCGGFNLQNCWSTGYIAGKAIAFKST